MFEFIRGNVAKIGTDYVAVDVGGVGYKIYTSLASLGAVKMNETATFYTSLSVTEDDMRLFGFTTEDERSIYELLISVSGVGPKMGLAVLSGMSARDFTLAVSGGNWKALTKAKGVGQKLAQKIVLELKDKISTSVPNDAEGVDAPGVSPSDAFFGDSVYNEAVEALTVLGINPQKAKAAVGNVYKDGMKLDEVVKLALKG